VGSNSASAPASSRWRAPELGHSVLGVDRSLRMKVLAHEQIRLRVAIADENVPRPRPAPRPGASTRRVSNRGRRRRSGPPTIDRLVALPASIVEMSGGARTRSWCFRDDEPNHPSTGVAVSLAAT
jgi:hypothetical protein